MKEPGITTVQVFRALGIDPSPEQSWSVGSRMQRVYQLEHGAEPPKENRPKTSGSGTHCFAIYPASWRPRIEAVIREVVAEDGRQEDLFG